MPDSDPQVDEYIASMADFAKPVLTKIRNLIRLRHSELEETIKWNFPNYTLNGKIVCYMAGFKHHCAFGFRGAANLDSSVKVETITRTAMGNLGKITSVEDLPSDSELSRMIDSAVAEIIENREKKSSTVKRIKKVIVPADLMKALTANAVAQATFKALSNSGKKDYVEWITQAKTQKTRSKRLLQAIEWMNEGKDRNWKYRKK